MNYPSGKSVQIGDVIWINEGTQKGKVIQIVETEIEISNWGLAEPGIYVHLSNTAAECDVFIFERHFNDEGIDKIV